MRLSGSGTLQVNGASLEYTTVGNGPAVVVLHGGPGLGYRYLVTSLTDVLAGSHTLVFYDQRGSGHSTGLDNPASITMDTFVTDLDLIREAAGLERLTLLGHSFGGLLAIQYAGTHPERVDRLVLVDSDPATWDWWVRFRDVVASRQTDGDVAELRRIQATEGWQADPTRAERAFKVSLRPYFADPAKASELEFGLDDVVLGKRTATYQLMRDDLGRYDIRDRLSRISARTLIVHGARGIFPREAAEALNDSIPRSELAVFEESGHFPHMEEPERFRSVVGGFLREP